MKITTKKVLLFLGGGAALALIVYYAFFKKKKAELPPINKEEAKEEFASSNPYVNNKFDSPKFETPEEFGAMAERLETLMTFQDRYSTFGVKGLDRREELRWALSVAPITVVKMQERGWLEAEDPQKQRNPSDKVKAEEEDLFYKINALLVAPHWMPSQLAGQKRRQIPKAVFESRVFSGIRDLLEKSPGQVDKIVSDRFSAAGGLASLPPEYISTGSAALASQVRAEVTALYFYDNENPG